MQKLENELVQEFIITDALKHKLRMFYKQCEISTN